MKYQYSKSHIAEYSLAKTEMQKEKQWEFVAQQLVNEGWTKVVLNSLIPTLGMTHSVDVLLWADENCVDHFVHNGRTWLFENEKDATMFILRWA